ncbi:S8 family peptidase [Mechercharimyces sp. CAU 1602]|uniref:S8 family peptidase n=1 Tax=Mechercharimyces sp. CAU 1602 TaxID=2973933 RepID=UPI0021633461|nr:S8 family peptidase [Mechercharimyces sp. CAU 1602]MCS1350170.1 S8 family peptidase [Mechercharimyces sp. CAU 1602]
MDKNILRQRKLCRLGGTQIITWNVKRVLGEEQAGRYPNLGKGVRVGVIDTGIDLTHPDLANNVQGGVNFIQTDQPPQDENGHGTHVAGIIGARNSRTGIIGVAPAVSLYAIKVLDKDGLGSMRTLIHGIKWGIDNRMDILNISITGETSSPPELVEIIELATKKGILVIAASGNRGNLRGKGDCVESPARLPSVEAVAALDRQNRRALFSATGPEINIAAPGVQILSTYLDGQYAKMSGTSMAAPHVSGVAALLKCAYPQANNKKLRLLLHRQARRLTSKRMDRLTGAGLVRAWTKRGRV